jgi:hypothetical protein
MDAHNFYMSRRMIIFVLLSIVLVLGLLQVACAGSTQVIVVTATPVNSPVIQVVTVIITPTPVVVSGDTPQPPLATTEPPPGVNVEQTLTVQAAQFILTSQAGQAQSALTVQAAQAMLTA